MNDQSTSKLNLYFLWFSYVSVALLGKQNRTNWQITKVVWSFLRPLRSLPLFSLEGWIHQTVLWAIIIYEIYKYCTSGLGLALFRLELCRDVIQMGRATGNSSWEGGKGKVAFPSPVERGSRSRLYAASARTKGTYDCWTEYGHSEGISTHPPPSLPPRMPWCPFGLLATCWNFWDLFEERLHVSSCRALSKEQWGGSAWLFPCPVPTTDPGVTQSVRWWVPPLGSRLVVEDFCSRPWLLFTKWRPPWFWAGITLSWDIGKPRYLSSKWPCR